MWLSNNNKENGERERPLILIGFDFQPKNIHSYFLPAEGTRTRGNRKLELLMVLLEFTEYIQ